MRSATGFHRPLRDVVDLGREFQGLRPWLISIVASRLSVGGTPIGGDRGRSCSPEGGKRGVGRRLKAGFGGKWLCSITRIYTHLHDKTQWPWQTAFNHGWENGIVRPGQGRAGMVDAVPWVGTHGYSCSATSWLVRVKDSRRDADCGDRDGRAPLKVEKGVLEGGWRRVLAENGCAQLHVFTRIYTIKHNGPGE